MAEPALTFPQARLLLRLMATPGASLFVEMIDNINPNYGPTFRGFFYHPACPTCRHANRESANWRVIYALSEAGHIKSTWGAYDKVTKTGRAAAEAARVRWPNMVVEGGRGG